MDNLAYKIEDLYNEAKERARAQGAFQRDQWNDLVEAVLNDKHEFQEMDDDAAIAQIKADLQSRYDEFQKEIGIM